MKPAASMSGTLLILWIWLAAYLNLAGWVLSLTHQLNRTGYCIALAVFVAAAWKGRAALGWPLQPAGRWSKFCRRYYKPLPAIFLAMTLLVFLGGLFWPPTNYDALTYRLPRILNWLDAGHWFWINAINDRMNFSGAGWEWLAAPHIALLHTDRTLFLINFLGFCLLPGLLYSVFHRLGVKRRVARAWMWLFPLGYGYVMQAGGLGNDITGAVFCLASVHFGLRARESGRIQDVWLALLSVALLTGLKLTNLPLALPCVVAVWPVLPLLRRAIVKSAVVAVLAVAASALPVMGINRAVTGGAGGDPQNVHQAQIASPVAGLFGNSLQLLQQSLLPPVFPGAPALFSRFNEQLLPAGCRDYLKQNFPRYFLGGFTELPSEENAGLGFGASLTVLLVLAGSLVRLGRSNLTVARPPAVLIIAAAWVALLFFLAKIGSEATARLLLPYYPLAIIPILWLPIQELWLRHRAWRLWLLLAGLSVLPAVVLSPARPLWPAQRLSQAWLEKHPDSKLARRLATTYATYANRNDLLRPIRGQIPGDVHRIAFAAGSNDAEYSLWRPFGTRTVCCLWRGRERQDPVLPDDIEWLVVHVREWDYFSTVPLEEWAARQQLEIVATIPIVTFAKHGADDWCVLRRVRAGGDSAEIEFRALNP